MKKVLVMDVDGTLTDGKLYIGLNGEKFKVFNIRDGYGIRDICSKNGIIPVVLTGRESDIVIRRCKEINITQIYQNVSNKAHILNEISIDLGIHLSDFAFIGDDLNDKECICLINEKGGTTACPANSDKKILDIVTYRCSKNGGDGAVREFIDYLVENT